MEPYLTNNHMSLKLIIMQMTMVDPTHTLMKPEVMGLNTILKHVCYTECFQLLYRYPFEHTGVWNGVYRKCPEG
jgi:hypothetical protein